MTIAKFYYECHITIAPVFDCRLEEAKDIASGHGFKVASLLMKKREIDQPTVSMYDTFMTGHSKDIVKLKQSMLLLISDLMSAGFTIYRYKIEDIIIDSRIHDEYSIFSDNKED
jgi:hypothetical protein